MATKSTIARSPHRDGNFRFSWTSLPPLCGPGDIPVIAPSYHLADGAVCQSGPSRRVPGQQGAGDSCLCGFVWASGSVAVDGATLSSGWRPWWSSPAGGLPAVGLGSSRGAGARGVASGQAWCADGMGAVHHRCPPKPAWAPSSCVTSVVQRSHGTVRSVRLRASGAGSRTPRRPRRRGPPGPPAACVRPSWPPPGDEPVATAVCARLVQRASTAPAAGKDHADDPMSGSTVIPHAWPARGCGRADPLLGIWT